DATLAAGLARGEDLARIAEATRIESLAQLAHEGEIGLAEDQRHVAPLRTPYPARAGTGPADLGADLEDLAACLDHARFFTRNARIVEDVRMQVTVTRVEDVAHAKAVRRRDLVHPRQHLWEPRAWDDAVHDHVGGRDAAIGAERALAPLPQELALRLVAGRPRWSRAPRRSRAPPSRRAGIPRSAGLSRPYWGPSSSMRGAAAASRGWPQPKASSPASMVVWSIISIAAGMRPREITADTA